MSAVWMPRQAAYPNAPSWCRGVVWQRLIFQAGAEYLSPGASKSRLRWLRAPDLNLQAGLIITPALAACIFSRLRPLARFVPKSRPRCRFPSLCDMTPNLF